MTIKVSDHDSNLKHDGYKITVNIDRAIILVVALKKNFIDQTRDMDRTNLQKEARINSNKEKSGSFAH